jgi:arylsulfatase A-like enzyme
MAGPNVAPSDLGRVRIYDLAPTLLASMGASVPAESDGRVLFEAFDPAFTAGLDVQEVEAAATHRNGARPSSAAVEARLMALGYL